MRTFAYVYWGIFLIGLWLLGNYVFHYEKTFEVICLWGFAMILSYVSVGKEKG